MTARKLDLSTLVVQLFSCCFHCRNAAIMGLVCHLLAVEGRGNLQDYCPLLLVLTTLTIDLAIFRLGILLLTFVLLIKHWADIGVAGKFQLLTFGTHFHLIHSSLKLPIAGVPY